MENPMKRKMTAAKPHTKPTQVKSMPHEKNTAMPKSKTMHHKGKGAVEIKDISTMFKHNNKRTESDVNPRAEKITANAKDAKTKKHKLDNLRI